jgi:nucleotide-binding universal stress UspA family protein
MKVDRILCPVDFSEFTAPALERAVQLANWFDARVVALYVLPFPVPAGVGLPYFPAPPESTKSLRQDAERHLAEVVAPFLGEGVPIETKVLEGDPWRVIREEAQGLPADLLVMGTHGRGGFEHLLLGSVTEKVLRVAPCPVLTVGHVPPHPRKGPLFRRILCAADLTGSSERTLDQALSLASENDARITLLHVLEFLADTHEGRLHVSVPDLGPLRRDLEDHALGQLRRSVPEGARDFCEVTERVESGRAWSEILRVAEELDADLIVMGAHSKGALGRLFFGSTANQVVRRATCPVLLVQERADGRAHAVVEEAAGAASSVRK